MSSTAAATRDAAPSKAPDAGGAAAAIADGQPPVKPVADASLPLKLGNLRLSVPDQAAPAASCAPSSAFASASGAAAAADAAAAPAARSPAAPGSGARPPPSPMARGLLARRGSYTERPIDVVRLACITQRNELLSLFNK
jgi:hypothetical protein